MASDGALCTFLRQAKQSTADSQSRYRKAQRKKKPNVRKRITESKKKFKREETDCDAEELLRLGHHDAYVS